MKLKIKGAVIHKVIVDVEKGDEVNLIHSELTGSFRVVSLPVYMEVCLKDRNIMK